MGYNIIINEKFWNSFSNGIFEVDNELDFPFLLEEFQDIQRYCYFSKIHKDKYEISVLSIKNAFYIILQLGDKIIMTFEYNLTRKRTEVSYYKKYVKSDEKLRKLLNLIELELEKQEIILNHRKLERGRLSYQKPIKIILNTILWQKFKLESKIKNPEKKKYIHIISQRLNLIPSSIVLYGIKSPDPNVQKVAKKIYKYILADKYQISDEWYKLKEKNPKLSNKEIIQRIAKIRGVKATTIASNARYSDDKQIRRVAIWNYGKLQLKKHDLTLAWKNDAEKHPDSSNLEIINRLAELKKLSPYTVANICTHSSNKEIRDCSIYAYLELMAQRYNITEKWLRCEVQYNKAAKISKKIKLSSLTIILLAIASNDKRVKVEAISELEHHVRLRELDILDRQSKIILRLHPKLRDVMQKNNFNNVEV